MKTCGNLLECMEELRKVNPTMTVQTAAVFLYVAGHPDCPTADILARLGLHRATASNILGQLEMRGRRASMALLMHTEDHEDARRKLYRLAPMGERIARSLLSIADKEDTVDQKGISWHDLLTYPKEFQFDVVNFM